MHEAKTFSIQNLKTSELQLPSTENGAIILFLRSPANMEYLIPRLPETFPIALVPFLDLA